ncbi:Sla2p [Sugiyamaella lignohabitans]|uniref:Sla2p n=1 Tax=Sugiyamaella lignohabitans TaxID=796027 RepID=A0A167CWQ7_9ASCO|nr:Sla2p [Sugiyamaella lignohabitans]ANB12196.1 Sla2p [Sugiyamaella lignohabitans]
MSANTGALSRAEADLGAHVKKATNPDETAPKRKHVRACIVYSWDHRSGRAFWNALKVQPLQNDEVQVFKALITVHKVLQEGHPSVLKEAQAHVNWINSLTHGINSGPGGHHGYSRLIQEYARLLLKKLSFHRSHPVFNGTFEYEEYISLRSVNDPNEGYEIIIDLMNLQDAIDDFQRLVFSSLHSGRSNECKISSLTPMVAESYGIYRFSTSMLRAMHSTAGDLEALEPLRSRYHSQHRRLLDFYYDCSSLKYLTSLITIPNLRPEPPNLYGEEDEAPALPKRPGQGLEREASIGSSNVTPTPTPSVLPEQESAGDWWGSNNANANAQLLQQQQLEEQQRQLQAQRDAELLRQQQLAEQQQRQFEEQQRLQLEQQQQAQQALIRDQMQRQAEGRAAELERDILQLRGQYEQNQLLLEQYDRRVKALETELGQLNTNTSLQLESKNDLIQSLQEQVSMWKTKYESLAKLYSQLRQEHLDLLSKFKQVQAKAASAQEAIDKRERLERDLKAKNLELADLIRERDRARYDLDKSRGSSKDQLEKLERDLRLMQDKLNDAERAKGADLSLLISRHNRELAELEDALKAKQRALDDISNGRSVNESVLREKEEEADILRETIASMENAMKEMSLDHQASSGGIRKLAAIIDAILNAAAERIQESLFEFESPMQAGNQNSTPNYLLSVIEKTSTNATDFSTAFNNHLAEGEEGSDPSEIIRTATAFANAISDVLINAKGITRLARNDDLVDEISAASRESAVAATAFFTSLVSDLITGLTPEDTTDLVISCNVEVQQHLQTLSHLAEQMAPKLSVTTNGSTDLGDIVDNEMARVAEAIATATAKLTQLLARPKDPKFSTFDVQVNEAILAAAIAVTSAVAALIKASTECQQEIVARGRGSSSRTAYYKKHNRWTEGLISAAKVVAGATNILISSADGVLAGKSSPEQLIAASNEVAASTAQLVAASRVNASFMSKTQDKLELASKSVSSACRALVNKVQDILAQRSTTQAEEIDYSKLTPHEFRTAAMEQQVEVLKLEQQLTAARNRLFEIRKIDYQNEEED